MSRRWKPLLLALLLALPERVFAHAHLLTSAPVAGATLVQSPEWIRLWFSEAPERSMTRVTLTDSTGVVIPIGPVQLQPTERLGVQVKVTRTLRPGRYRVRWVTAGPDGHPSRGSFTFIVATPPSAQKETTGENRDAPNGTGTGAPGQTAATTESSGAMDVTSPWYVAARALEFAALLVIVGAVVFRLAVVSRLSTLDDPDARQMSSLSARLGAIAALSLVAAAALRLILQSRLMSAMVDDASMRALSATRWGHALVYQAVLTAFALAGFLLARRGVRGGWLLAGVAAVALATSPALEGHAAASPHLTTLSIAIDTFHVLGASGWLGTLFCGLSIGVPIALGSEQRWQSVATLVDAFSPVALTCAGLTALTGLASAWLRLGSIDALTSTTYGRVLIVKLALLAALAATGAYNWRRVKPSLGTAEATGRLRTLGTTELMIGFLIVVVTALLVALPTPSYGS
jgi:copper transport protein